ncbi:MAG: hypothetical protein KIT14_05215 [bacterium]|nr:hypothetical protein [bacterium]
MSLSEPLPSRLPLAAERTAWRWALAGLVLLAGAVAGATYLGPGPGPAVAGVCLTLGIVALLLAAARHLGVRKDRSVVDAMAAGDYIAFWIVPPEVWRAHLAQELAAQPAAARIATIAGAAISGLVVALMLGIRVAEGGDVRGDLVPAAALGGGVTLLFGLVGLAIQSGERGRTRRLARREGVICIADRGLYHAGELWPHDRGIPRFLGVELLPGPPRLLSFSYFFWGPKGSITLAVRVPMPPTDAVIRPDVILARLSGR